MLTTPKNSSKISSYQQRNLSAAFLVSVHRQRALCKLPFLRFGILFVCQINKENNDDIEVINAPEINFVRERETFSRQMRRDGRIW